MINYKEEIEQILKSTPNIEITHGEIVDGDVDDLCAKIEALTKKAELEAREVFVPVRDYEGLYEVSNTGKVRSISRGRNTGRELKQNKRFRDYLAVQLSKDNFRKSYNVHRLVAEAFISNPENKRTVNHIDNNQSNNDVSNLEWATHSEQEYHAYKMGKVNANHPSRTNSEKE